ncbi:MAG: hypothetical protein SFW07_06825, partial [Gammaproteobacteria bacterium]|nr:hypothetical protein [Gammaproteobacteria bacterium]
LLINSFFAAVLFKFQWYTHGVVLVLSVGLTGIAVIRQYFYYVRHRFEGWQKRDGYILWINFVGVIPLLVMSSLTAFMDTDALASWNLWAQYYYLVEQHAAVFLPARGYPPFLPLMLSYIYKFLGTTYYQGVAKSILILFPLTVMNCIAFAGKITEKSWAVFICYIAMIAASIFGVIGYRFYSEGFADPLLAACLALAILYTVLYCDASEDNNLFMLVLAVLATMATSISKQPGFLWALFSFPLIVILKMIRAKQYSYAEITAIIIAAIPCLCWVLGPGSHFVQNTGVIHASTGSNTFKVGPLFSAMGYSIIKYWIKMPWLFLLYAWATYSVWNRRTPFLIYLSFVVPGTILWFMLGSYDGRLGFQLLGACAVLIALNQFYPMNKIGPVANIKRIFQVSVVLGVLSFVFFSINENFIKHGFVRGQLYPLNGPRTILGHYFGQDAEYIYNLIYLHPEKTLWIPDGFVQFYFTNNNAIISPPSTGNVSEIYNGVMLSKPDYLIIKEPGTFPPEDALKKIVATCPFLFKPLPLATKPVPFNYKVFELMYSSQAALQCQNRISRENH